MALNWKEIKGFNGTTSTNILYTYIRFTSGTTPSVSNEFLPQIIVTKGGTAAEYNLGKIVTAGVSNTFTENNTFTKSIYAHDIIFDYQGASNYKIIRESANSLNFYLGQNKQIEWWSDKIKFNTTVEAEAYNATSDRRVKTNILPVTQSALDLLKNINIYTFNYTYRPDYRSIGVIAQELLDLNVDGFSFVDNREATGENHDFMAVMETKFTYLLIKAVQELSAEIESLKAQLQNK